ncbi:protein of unknown function [Pseudodesulfovibrio profundus]|uniref:Uncharacterized protein n=1 Tax=Pseudodesulfovibrio profundus TaxID=57320 RepID=A0A2C8FDV8_9BACT|nr:hypothetical protein [Pseudodesulfovibrio profundus]SOB60646.1 protein of unknown function [Pseudodesulfovibrio profundus]
MGFLDNNGLALAYGLNSGLQAFNAAQDRNLKRQMWEGQQERQGMLDDMTRKQFEMQQNQFNRQQNQQAADVKLAANPQLLSTIGMQGPFAPSGQGQGLVNMPSTSMAWKAREAMTPAKREPSTKIEKLQAYLGILPEGDPRRAQVEAAIQKEITPSSAVKVDVNTGNKAGEILSVDKTNHTAVISDPTAENGMRVVALPGGKTESEKTTRARTGGTAAAIAVRELDYVLGSLGIDPESGKRVQGSSVAGPRGRMLADSGVGRYLVAGTGTGDFMGTLQSIKDTIAINRLLEIKASGAGLGQVPQSQLEALARALGNLNPETSDELLTQNLMDVRNLYADVVRRSATDANDKTFTHLMEKTMNKPGAATRRIGTFDPDAEADRLIKEAMGGQ